MYQNAMYIPIHWVKKSGKKILMLAELKGCLT